jgi:AcrR family transcriptional regulator
VSEAPSLVARHPRLEPRLGDRREDVAEGQRARVLAAMARVVGAEGYAATTVADVVREAGVSRSTFYEQFASKEACFLESYRHGVEVLSDVVGQAVHEAGRAGTDWREGLRAGIRGYLDALAAEPLFARTYLLEIHAAGEPALALRGEALRRFAARYGASARAAGLREPHPDALLVLCAGTEQLCAERLREHGAPALRELEDVFMLTAEAVLLGANPDHKET